MKFKELDARMRVHETARDYCVLPGMYIVARLDGRNFTRLTKEVCDFEAPFDERFRDMMLATAEHLMDCGFKIIFAYTQSDEISLLFHPRDEAFDRKMRKINSVLAGEASARFSISLGMPAVFDCRVCEIPNEALLIDYFRWRSEDALRNALSAHCYWALRREGLSPRRAASRLDGLGTSAKNELLFERGINFNDLPNWQKRGSGLYHETFTREARNPLTDQVVHARRRRIRRDLELPRGEDYDRFIRGVLAPYLEVA